MIPNTERQENETATIQLRPFLLGLRQAYTGEYIAVHTGRGTYVGRLLSVTPVCIILDSDSDALDGPAHIRIDPARVEAVEVLAS